MNKIIPGYTVRLDDGTRYKIEAEQDYTVGICLSNHSNNGTLIDKIYIPSELYSCIVEMINKAIEHSTVFKESVYVYDKTSGKTDIKERVLDDYDIVHYDDTIGTPDHYGRVGL
jgi:hypothetical protein